MSPPAHYLALAAASLTLAAPAVAGAAPHHLTHQERQVLASRGIGAPTPPVREIDANATPAASGSDGFDWGSAGAGAGAVGGLVVLAGGLAMVRRAQVKERLS